MRETKSFIQLVRDVGLQKEPCASCRPTDPSTKCSYNEAFTNCPWTGRLLPWARDYEGMWVTIGDTE